MPIMSESQCAVGILQSLKTASSESLRRITRSGACVARFVARVPHRVCQVFWCAASKIVPSTANKYVRAKNRADETFEKKSRAFRSDDGFGKDIKPKYDFSHWNVHNKERDNSVNCAFRADAEGSGKEICLRLLSAEHYSQVATLVFNWAVREKSHALLQELIKSGLRFNYKNEHHNDYIAQLHEEHAQDIGACLFPSGDNECRQSLIKDAISLRHDLRTKSALNERWDRDKRQVIGLCRIGSWAWLGQSLVDQFAQTCGVHSRSIISAKHVGDLAASTFQGVRCLVENARLSKKLDHEIPVLRDRIEANAFYKQEKGMRCFLDALISQKK